MPYAFRCKNCNSLEEAEHAGERSVPAKCRTCGKGVLFTPDGIKSYDEANWIVLADLDGDGLADVLDYHKIEADEIVAHVPSEPVDPDHVPVHVEVSAEDVIGADDLAAAPEGLAR